MGLFEADDFDVFLQMLIYTLGMVIYAAAQFGNGSVAVSKFIIGVLESAIFIKFICLASALFARLEE